MVRMIDQAFAAAKAFGNVLLLLDHYFLSIPAWNRLNEWNQSGPAHLHIVTKAKASAVAYERPAVKKKGRGRPPKKDKPVKLMVLFQTCVDSF
ncbi:hypothetical protein [Paenibacillus apiarius]|uniref:hypothetical protein n=1 Tax=Paenibacillus apiarius TaxID=46240 RepID=UPI003B3B8F0E